MVLYGVGISVTKMLKFYVKVFYVIGKALSGELSFTGGRSCSYSRTSMARTLMAHLPWLFRTLSWVPWN